MNFPLYIFLIIFVFFNSLTFGQQTNTIPKSTSISDINLFLNEFESLKTDSIQTNFTLQSLKKSSNIEFQVLYHILNAKSNASKLDKLNKTSLNHFNKAFSLSKSNLSLNVWAKFNYIEYLYYYRSISDAIPILLTTIEVSDKLDSQNLIQPAKMYKLSGWIFQTIDDYQESKKYLEKALSFADSQPDEKSAILNALGQLYFKNNNLDIAENYFNQTLNLALKQNDYIRYAKALGSLSEIESAKGNFTKAISLVQKDLNYSIKFNDIQNTMYAYVLLAKYYLNIKDKASAKKALVSAEEIAKSKTYYSAHEYEIMLLKLDLLEGDDLVEEVELRRKLAVLEKVIEKTDGQKVIQRLNWNLQKQKYQTEISQANLVAQNNNYKSLLALFLLVIIAIVFTFFYYRNQQKLKFANIKAQETERERIASDLHDNIINKLTVIRLKSILNHDVKEIDSLLQLVIDDSRRLSHHLSPPMLESQTIETSLQQVLSNWSGIFKVNFEVSNPNNIDISNENKIHVIRIVQELIQNVYKHANATKIDCSIIVTDKDFEITFSDNGKGLDKDLAKNNSGIGLKNIQNRLKQIKATYNLNSNNKGTTFVFKTKNA